MNPLKHKKNPAIIEIAGLSLYGGVGGIRTLGRLLTVTRFPVVLVMTASIPLHDIGCLCHFRNSSIIIHKTSAIVKYYFNYFCNSAAQTESTFAAMGAATALPLPPFSTKTTKARGQASSCTKPANMALAV